MGENSFSNDIFLPPQQLFLTIAHTRSALSTVSALWETKGYILCNYHK